MLQRTTIPPVRTQPLHQRCIEPPAIARRDVRLDVGALAHPGDDRGDVWIREDEAERQLGHGHPRGNVGAKPLYALDGGTEVVAGEVDVAEVALGPGAVQAQRPGERA